MQKAAGENWHFRYGIAKFSQGLRKFRYGIAKFSQGLRKFRNGSENLAILTKISLCHIFRYHSENSLS